MGACAPWSEILSYLAELNCALNHVVFCFQVDSRFYQFQKLLHSLLTTLLYNGKARLTRQCHVLSNGKKIEIWNLIFYVLQHKKNSVSFQLIYDVMYNVISVLLFIVRAFPKKNEQTSQ